MNDGHLTEAQRLVRDYHEMLALLREVNDSTPPDSWEWVSWTSRVAELLKRLGRNPPMKPMMKTQSREDR